MHKPVDKKSAPLDTSLSPSTSQPRSLMHMHFGIDMNKDDGDSSISPVKKTPKKEDTSQSLSPPLSYSIYDPKNGIFMAKPDDEDIYFGKEGACDIVSTYYRRVPSTFLYTWDRQRVVHMEAQLKQEEEKRKYPSEHYKISEHHKTSKKKKEHDSTHKNKTCSISTPVGTQYIPAPRAPVQLPTTLVEHFPKLPIQGARKVRRRVKKKKILTRKPIEHKTIPEVTTVMICNSESRTEIPREPLDEYSADDNMLYDKMLSEIGEVLQEVR
eukprot:gnl/Carplike_NY0171/6495_a8925_187.p1 GENE.gnl/Carplike_NY0171/6495_a8925_187~~gnl/Carplike_NY0171/6495_a8925_187.p1  ORF type:complete len:288 (-),score=37.58 gnl/Carplike_NY0171/6495_a8925_187:119-925(-)